ncbi:MAG: hypothetical protein OXP68_13255 [Anaerolineaceae bacterium]|nr:hypothetical protein [Anaerolineaceae bacterium]MDE0328909.1 hypothetical protein [Anaerolineaceae bacterium]
MTDLYKDALRAAAYIQADANAFSSPPLRGQIPKTTKVLNPSWFGQGHQHLLPVVEEINGTYESGWYDASAAMLRRLTETLIIEAFEAKQISEKITKKGEFRPLGELIGVASKETSLKLSRHSKRTLRDIAALGNTAAHDRSFNLPRDLLEERLLPIQLLILHLLDISITQQ